MTQPTPESGTEGARLTAQQLYVLGRANRQLSLTADLYGLGRRSQSATAGRWRVISNLARMGLIDKDDQITEAGRSALSAAQVRP